MNTDDVPRINIREFRELGFLQEVNRLFFHPLGLALEVIRDDKTGEETLGGIWDCRQDPEGIYFVLTDDDARRAHQIADEWNSRVGIRLEALGFIIQPLPDGTVDLRMETL